MLFTTLEGNMLTITPPMWFLYSDQFWCTWHWLLLYVKTNFPGEKLCYWWMLVVGKPVYLILKIPINGHCLELRHLPVIALQLFDRAQRLPSLWSRLVLFRAALALFVTIPLPFLCPMPIYTIWLWRLSCTRFFNCHFVLFLPCLLRCLHHLWFLTISWYIL
jgi:hypothetical protein